MAIKMLKYLFVHPHGSVKRIIYTSQYPMINHQLLSGTVSDIAQSVLFDRRNDSDQNLIRTVDDYKPDIAYITAHNCDEIKQTKYLAQIIKKIRPQVVCAVGGMHSTLLPEDLFSEYIDIICLDSGERTLRDIGLALCNRTSFKNIPLVLLKQTAVEYTSTAVKGSLSKQLSFKPAEYSENEPTKQNHYKALLGTKENTIMTLTSLGCKNQCSYCPKWLMANGTIRCRNPYEIAMDMYQQPQNKIYIMDDHFFDNREVAIEAYYALKKMGFQKKIVALIQPNVAVEQEDLLERWREIGLESVILGIDAVSNETLKLLKKKTTDRMNRYALKMLEKLKIKVWPKFWVMAQYEREDFSRLWEFVEEYSVLHPIFVPLTPTPGTALFYEVKKQEQISIYDYAYFGDVYMPLKTTIPKHKWYEYYWNLNIKSVSMKHFVGQSLKRKNIDIKTAIERSKTLGKGTYRQMNTSIEEQLETEKSIHYHEIEHLLLPSLKKDYAPSLTFDPHQPETIKLSSEETGIAQNKFKIKTPF